MKYRVIKLFMDLQDKNHLYNVGDEYPRKGLKPTEKRIAELASENNKQGVPLIEKVVEPEKQDGGEQNGGEQNGEADGEK